MEWEFTPEEVVKGDVQYGLEQLRADMLEEVKINMSQMESVVPEKVFNVIYDLCYWVATGNDYDEFINGLDQESFFPEFLRSIREHLQSNIEMLGAILQRLIMDRVDDQSMPLELALKEVDAHHRSIASRSPALN
jgi:hypothetical protein